MDDRRLALIEALKAGDLATADMLQPWAPLFREEMDAVDLTVEDALEVFRHQAQSDVVWFINERVDGVIPALIAALEDKESDSRARRSVAMVLYSPLCIGMFDMTFECLHSATCSPLI